MTLLLPWRPVTKSVAVSANVYRLPGSRLPGRATSQSVSHGVEKYVRLHGSIWGEDHVSVTAVVVETEAENSMRADDSTSEDAGSRMSTCGGEMVGDSEGAGVTDEGAGVGVAGVTRGGGDGSGGNG